MQLTERLILNEIFAQNAASKRHEARLFEQMDRDIAEQERKENREKEDEERLEHSMAATVDQVAAFRVRLDGYDTTVVHALMDNERTLNDARHHREELEAHAFQAPDGRRVFKSESGERVFDQHGGEVTRDVVDPAAISDLQPSWETYRKAADSEQVLTQDREKLHGFQKRLDSARETLGKGPISADALAEMDAALQRDMPESVKAKLPGAETGQEALNSEKAMPAHRTAAPYAGRINGP